MSQLKSVPHKAYLGDGVYAEYDGYQIRLSTEGGYGKTNVVFVDPYVLHSLNEFYKKVTTLPPTIKEIVDSDEIPF